LASILFGQDRTPAHCIHSSCQVNINKISNFTSCSLSFIHSSQIVDRETSIPRGLVEYIDEAIPGLGKNATIATTTGYIGLRSTREAVIAIRQVDKKRI